MKRLKPRSSNLKVTDIKQQVKRQGRYSVFVDDKYAFSLSENELLQSGIRIGKEYTSQELEQLKQTAILDKAYMRAIDYLARRQRSEWELREYLRRKEYDSPTVDTILNKLSIKGYVDDKKFAEAWVANRRQLKPTSLRRLRQELAQKRVSKEVAEAVLADDTTDEEAVVRQLVAKKRTQTRYQDNQKLIAYLLRQGFSYDIIKEVIG